MWGRDPRAAANCIRYDAEHYLDPRGHIGAYANHSCRPNTALFREGKRLVLRAIRRIRAWEELTHDYATLLGADDIWTMRCNCGERNCRGVVRRVDRLPPAVLRRYLRLGAVPDYVLATCDRL